MMQNLDKLTGLYTQSYFEKRLKDELARTNRYKRPLSLVLFEINYNYFMTEQDVRWAMVYTILKQFGELLQKQLRIVDIAGRYGGENFAVLLPETPLEGGAVVAERIRRKVEGLSFVGDSVNKEIRVALNGGLAAYPIHGKNSREILSSASQGLLVAASQGSNQIAICPHYLYDENGNSLLYTEETVVVREIPDIPPPSKNKKSGNK